MQSTRAGDDRHDQPADMKVLAIDIGGTKVHAAVVDSEGRIYSAARVVTPTGEAAEVVTAAVIATAQEALAGHEDDVVTCGVAVPGGVTGGSVWTLNIPSWRHYDLRARLDAALGIPCSLENDGNAMTLAEGWVGAARGHRNYLAMVVSTGIGGGIVLDGRLLRGEGRAGRLGHVPVDPDGRRCDCGGTGCLEAEASGKAIEQMISAPAKDASPEVIERSGRMVGRGIANVASLLDLQTVVIGGSVALGYGEPFFSAVTDEAMARCTLGTSMALNLSITPPGLGADAPVLGAAAVAFGVGRQAT